MSWEKVSGIRYNYKKNILDLKSHSNNDDADPTWWSFGKNKDIKERLLGLYQSSFEDGDIQLGGFTGNALKFKYGFVIYDKYLKEHKEKASLENVHILIAALDTADTKDYCNIKYDYDYVCSFNKYTFSYVYSKQKAKNFTFKQAVVFMKYFSKDYDFEIEYLVQDDEKRPLDLNRL